MTQCALESKKYDKVIYNEKETLIYNGFKMAVTGQFKNEKRWIDREIFNELKATDPYVAICYSFGNNLKSYCYSEILEPWKEALHYARVFKDYSKFKKFNINSNGSKTDIIKNFNAYKQKYTEYINSNISCDAMHFAELEHLERLSRLEHLERLSSFTVKQDNKHFAELQSLESLCRLQSLECLNESYENVKIPLNSVVYCDPPYKDIATYLSEFNHEDFYNWCRKQKSLVFISEYGMPDDFYLIHTFKRKDIFSDNSKDVMECLYCNKPFKVIGQSKKLF